MFAQEKDTSAAAVLDAVNVTGTRLKSQSMTASSPVAEINAEEFQYSGATKVEDLVNQYPQLSLNFDGFTNNGSDGYATVDLRGLGAKRTLTLVNGRRIPKGIIETPDITIIPTAIVKRVDLLTGGASAVYGSDAIAGVVNFVLDDAFHGISVNAGYSAYQHNNDNTYMRGLMDKAGYPYPKGDLALTVFPEISTWQSVAISEKAATPRLGSLGARTMGYYRGSVTILRVHSSPMVPAVAARSPLTHLISTSWHQRPARFSCFLQPMGRGPKRTPQPVQLCTGQLLPTSRYPLHRWY